MYNKNINHDKEVLIMKKIIPIILAIMLALMIPVSALAGEASGQPVTPGQSVDGVYTNASIGLKFEAPQGWTLYSEEEIAQMNGITKEIFKDTEAYQEFLEDAASWLDMLAQGQDNDSINISIQRLDEEQLRAFKDVSLSDILTLQQVDLINSLESAGYQNVTFELAETPDGFPVTGTSCARVTGDFFGNLMYLRQVFYRAGDCLICITAGSSGTDNTAEYLGYFTVA